MRSRQDWLSKPRKSSASLFPCISLMWSGGTGRRSGGRLGIRAQGAEAGPFARAPWHLGSAFLLWGHLALSP